MRNTLTLLLFVAHLCPALAQTEPMYIPPVVQLNNTEHWHQVLDYEMAYSSQDIVSLIHDSVDQVRLYISTDVINKKMMPYPTTAGWVEARKKEMEHFDFHVRDINIGKFTGIRYYMDVESTTDTMIRYDLMAFYDGRYFVSLNFQCLKKDSILLDRDVARIVGNCELISPSVMDEKSGMPYTINSVDSIINSYREKMNHTIDTMNLKRLTSNELESVNREMVMYGSLKEGEKASEEQIKKFVKEVEVPLQLDEEKKELDSLVKSGYSNSKFYTLKYKISNGLYPMDDYLNYDYNPFATGTDMYWLSHLRNKHNGEQFVNSGFDLCISKTIFKDTLSLFYSSPKNIIIGSDTTMWYVFDDTLGNGSYAAPTCFIKHKNTWQPVVTVLKQSSHERGYWSFDAGTDTLSGFIIMNQHDLHGKIIGAKTTQPQQWLNYDFTDKAQENYAVTYRECSLIEPNINILIGEYENPDYNESHSKLAALKKTAPYKGYEAFQPMMNSDTFKIKTRQDRDYLFRGKRNEIIAYNDSISNVRKHVLFDLSKKFTSADLLFITELAPVDLDNNGQKELVSIVVSNGNLINYHCYRSMGNSVLEEHNDEVQKKILACPALSKFIKLTAEKLQQKSSGYVEPSKY